MDRRLDGRLRSGALAPVKELVDGGHDRVHVAQERSQPPAFQQREPAVGYLGNEPPGHVQGWIHRPPAMENESGRHQARQE